MYQVALPSTHYPKFRSRSSTQPLGHVAYIVCYVFYILLVKIEKKSSLNCLFSKYKGVISFPALKTIEIDILYMFLCSLFQMLW